jgi:adenine-specific DNA-methyltransferase
MHVRHRKSDLCAFRNLFTPNEINTESALAALAFEVGRLDSRDLAESERNLVRQVVLPGDVVAQTRFEIQEGKDPLGDMFCAVRTPEQRRNDGATYTPLPLVHSMLGLADEFENIERIVDPGAGSGRFLIHAARRFPEANLIGVELDPLASIVCRANLHVLGLSKRATISVADYRTLTLSEVTGRTLFIGNPPYTRHHELSCSWKQWFSHAAAEFSLSASQLAGLHIHFYLQTAKLARRNDVGIFITAAEWLDVNYGSVLRQLFLNQLGGKSIFVLDPKSRIFSDAASTAAITVFEISRRNETIDLITAKDALLKDTIVRPVKRNILQASAKWSILTKPVAKKKYGFIELGELFSVHRGTVTGANAVWIAGPHAEELPRSVLKPTVTGARELFGAGETLTDATALKRVVDLPIDLDRFTASDRRRIDSFLKFARAQGAADTYVAKQRKAWWSVGLREPAPVLATYMARRPPTFVRNVAGAYFINIAHGLYPRARIGINVLKLILKYLNSNVRESQGRTYCGGLTKFEPREMERILLPDPEMLV